MASPLEEAFFARLAAERGAIETNGDVQILRAFDWISQGFTTFRERPLPGSYRPVLQPQFDVFGSSRIDQLKFAEVLGPLGQQEVLHTQVPAGRYRHYLSMQYSHDDAAGPIVLRAIRVITSQGAGVFPQITLRDDASPTTNELQAVRNVTIPPLGWIGAFAPALAVGARITLRVLWLEFPVGESFRSIL